MLTKKQREQLYEWVGAGLKTDEIKKLASEFEEPFEVSYALISKYRRHADIRMQEIVDSGIDEALKTGLALRSERVRVLKELAELLIKDIFGDNLWITEVRMRRGATIEVEKFNHAEVEQLRGVLDDIAREMGDRRAIGNISVSDSDTVIVYVPDNGRN